MKTSHKIAAAGAFAVSALAGMAHAQATSTGTGTGSVTLVAPITISNPAGLVFGRVNKPGASPATITIAANGSQTLSGVNAIGTQGNQAASFMVSGDGAAVFTIGTPSAFNMTASSSGTIAVTPVASAASGTLSGTAGSAGTAPFTVGGTASLAANQVAGAYTGTFTVVVNYN